MAKTSFKKPPFELDRSRYGDLPAQIASGLRRAIATGYYTAGEILPPGRELAVLLGVSKGIAEQSLALVREEGLISPRPRVGSVVCAKDRPLWKGHVVIVVPPGFGDPLATMVYSVLRDSLTTEGYLSTPATVTQVSPGKYGDFSLLDTVLRQQTDLVVLLHDQDAIAKWLSRRGHPFVRLTASCATPLPNCVGVIRLDFGMAVRPFARHCREAGVRSVLEVADFPLIGVAEALGEAGVKVSSLRVPRALHKATGFALGSWAAETFAKRLANGRDRLPDLIFFADDHLATGALLALGMVGVHIPDDVRVATWANRDYAPVFTKPLTRMEMDNASIGAKLAECVLDHLRNGDFPEGLVLGPEYIMGETL